MKQILIVEDDSFLNKMLAYNLTADGYGVTSTLNARTAAEAINHIEAEQILAAPLLQYFSKNSFEMSELCNNSACFSVENQFCSDISVTFGFYNNPHKEKQPVSKLPDDGKRKKAVVEQTI